MTRFDLKVYARRGAEARLAELNEEVAGIYRAFPDLRLRAKGPKAGRRGRHAVTGQSEAGGSAKAELATGEPARTGSRKPMTAAQRKAVGERMKKYWAERKARSAAKKR